MTAVVLTHDEESRLPSALGSVPPGAKILIVDAESTDGTRAIAERFGAQVVVRPWNGFVDARQFALGQVTTPWSLALDADELLDEELRAAILNCDGALAGYTIARDTSFCGKPLRMWRGERLLRLMRTSDARVEAHPASGGSAALHERYVVDGTVGDLAGRLAHNSYPTLASYREKFARYTAIEGAAGPCPTNLAAVLLRFVHSLVVRGAVLDGWRGVYVAWMSALYPYVAWHKANAR